MERYRPTSDGLLISPEPKRLGVDSCSSTVGHNKHTLMQGGAEDPSGGLAGGDTKRRGGLAPRAVHLTALDRPTPVAHQLATLRLAGAGPRAARGSEAPTTAKHRTRGNMDEGPKRRDGGGRYWPRAHAFSRHRIKKKVPFSLAEKTKQHPRQHQHRNHDSPTPPPSVYSPRSRAAFKAFRFSGGTNKIAEQNKIKNKLKTKQNVEVNKGTKVSLINQNKINYQIQMN